MSDLKIKNKMLRSIFIKTLEAEGISLKEYLDSLNIDAFDDVNEYLNNEKLFFQINTVDFFLNNLFIAYSATYLGLASLILNSPCATLLKFVFTGPGHKADTTTLLPLCLNSSLIAIVSLRT